MGELLRLVPEEVNFIFGTPLEYFLFLSNGANQSAKKDRANPFGNSALSDVHDRLKTALATEPPQQGEITNTLLWLADTLFKESRIAEGELVFDYLENLNNNNLSIIYRRGRSRLAHGMPKSAISSFQVVLNSQPDHQEALYHLLIAYVRAGQKRKLLK